MKNTFKFAHCAVLALSLTVASSAFAADTKMNKQFAESKANTAVVAPSLNPSEGYSGDMGENSVGEPVTTDLSQIDLSLDPTEAYHGSANQFTFSNASPAVAVNLGLDPTEAYHGF